MDRGLVSISNLHASNKMEEKNFGLTRSLHVHCRCAFFKSGLSVFITEFAITGASWTRVKIGLGRATKRGSKMASAVTNYVFSGFFCNENTLKPPASRLHHHHHPHHHHQSNVFCKILVEGDLSKLE